MLGVKLVKCIKSHAGGPRLRKHVAIVSAARSKREINRRNKRIFRPSVDIISDRSPSYRCPAKIKRISASVSVLIRLQIGLRALLVDAQFSPKTIVFGIYTFSSRSSACILQSYRIYIYTCSFIVLRNSNQLQL